MANKEIRLEQLPLIILLGAGKMGLALAKGWLKDGLGHKNLILVDPYPSERAEKFAKENNISLIPKIDNLAINILVVAIKPQIMGEVLPGLKPLISKKSLIISIAAGINIAQISKWLKSDNIVRAMPNTPAQLGKGVSAIVAGNKVSENDRQIAFALMKAVGHVEIAKNEDMLNALMMVSGCGPAYVFLLGEAMAKAGIELGIDKEQAYKLARQTIIGASALLEAETTQISTLRQNVTSKGGVTEAALSVLMAKGGIEDLMKQAFIKGLERNRELANDN